MEFKHPSGDALEVWVDGERTVVEADGRIEVTGEHAKQLEAQGWTRADKPKSRDSKDGE